MMTIILLGDPRTKKNTPRCYGSRRKAVLPSKQFVQYEAECLRQMLFDPAPLISTPINVQCVYYMRTRRRVDLVNLLSATCDILKDALVIEDDCSTIVASHDGSRVLYDKEHPRVEITITEVAPC